MPKTKKTKKNRNAAQATSVASALLRLPQVRARTGLSRSELYRRIANGEFPAQVKIGARASAWNSAEIDHWVAKRIAERDAIAAA